MGQVEKKDSVSINEPAPVASPRLSLSSLTDGIVRSIKFTGEEIKKAGAALGLDERALFDYAMSNRIVRDGLALDLPNNAFDSMP